MSFKNILMAVGNPEKSGETMDVAFRAALRFSANLCVLHVKPDPRELLPYASLAISAGIRQQVLDAAGRSAGERAEAVARLFDERRALHGVPLVEKPSGQGGASAFLRVESGREATVVAERGRLADLILARRPEKAYPPAVVLEALLRETGRPVLLLPPGASEFKAARVSIGWNCSTEAASAVAGAMPLLEAAERVHVLTTAKRARMRPSADDLVAYLAWHAVASSATVMDISSRSVAEALLAESAAVGSDLLVVGGYSRRRLREMIMGGVTRHLIEAAPIPVLMVH